MQIKEVSLMLEKYGYVVADVVEVPAGISKKTGKNYPAFASLKFLIHGSSEVTTYAVDMNYVDEIKAVTEHLEYLAPVKVIGIQNANGRFAVTSVENWEVKK